MRWMICSLLLLFALTACGPAGYSTDANGNVIITYDEGGVVTDYAQFYKNLAPSIIVKIDGWCASSCTLALARPNTCVTPRGYLGFHLAYRSVLGVHVTDQTLSDYLMSQYPARIRQWINDHGGLTADIKELKDDELHALVQTCT